MRIHRATTNRWQATDWVTASDVTNTGTTIRTSGNMEIDISALSGVVEAVIEWEYTQQRTGGTSNVRTWGVVVQAPTEASAGQGAAYPTVYTGWEIAEGTALTRRPTKWLAGLQGVVTAATTRLRLQVQAAGGAADTEFSVTGIRARLLYKTL